MTISLKELKKNRLTPAEKFVLETIDGVKPTTDSNGNVYWYKDGKCLFHQDFENGWLYVIYFGIWLGLKDKFGFNNDEIQELIKNVMYDYTNNGSLTPSRILKKDFSPMYDYTINKLKLKTIQNERIRKNSKRNKQRINQKKK